MSLPQLNANPQYDVERFYFTGTDAVLAGYAFALDLTASAVDADPKKRFGVAVAKPLTASLNAFVGIAAPGTDFTGPGFIDLIVPRSCDLVTALMNVNATAWTTALGLANNSYALVSYADATLNLGLVALATATADTSGTAANGTVKFVR